MKNALITLTVSAFILGTSSMYLTSCNGNSGKGATYEQADEEDFKTMDHDEMTESNDIVYACSMHPDVTGEKGDKCSKCGMTLVLLENGVDSEHADHEHN